MNIEKFATIAYERHKIYILKSAGAPKPWTASPVFQDYRFCNVFRRVDATTEWIMRHVAVPLAEDRHLWADLMLARYISRIDVLVDLYDRGAFDPHADWDTRRSRGIKRLIERVAAMEPINTAAFITSPMIGEHGPTKAHYLSWLLRSLDEDGFGEQLGDGNKTMKNTWTVLQNYRATGSFMAYQYVCDFSYIDRYLARSVDRDTWSAYGPGSKRGMQRLKYGKPEGPMSADEWLALMQTVLADWKAFIAVTLEDVTNSYMENQLPEQPTFVRKQMAMFADVRMQDVQHWLCEYDKYERGGSKKRSYHGRIYGEIMSDSIDRDAPIEIQGKMYFTVKQFAFKVNRSTATIYNLLGRGNAIRQLRCIRIDDKPFIPIEELTEYPFVSPGPNGKDRPYFFDENGAEL